MAECIQRLQSSLELILLNILLALDRVNWKLHHYESFSGFSVSREQTIWGYNRKTDVEAVHFKLTSRHFFRKEPRQYSRTQLKSSTLEDYVK